MPDILLYPSNDLLHVDLLSCFCSTIGFLPGTIKSHMYSCCGCCKSLRSNQHVEVFTAVNLIPFTSIYILFTAHKSHFNLLHPLIVDMEITKASLLSHIPLLIL